MKNKSLTIRITESQFETLCNKVVDTESNKSKIIRDLIEKSDKNCRKDLVEKINKSRHKIPIMTSKTIIMEHQLKKINDPDIVSFIKQGLDFVKSQNDTLYVLPNDFYTEAENITTEEESISNNILSKLGTSKSDDELIEINLRAIELFNFLVQFQRIIKSNLQKQSV